MPGECWPQRSRRCRTVYSWTPRAPEGRGARASWRRYASRVAEELDALGHSRTAERLRLCGTSCEVRTCHGCGDPFASVTVLAGCDVRACVLCARTRAARESVRVAKAADRVAGYVRAGLARAQSDVARALAERSAQARATQARERDCAKLRRWQRELRGAGRGGWSWRMVTLSPRWSPGERASYTPAALAARLDAVRAAWARLWSEHLGCGGHAAAYLSVEVSAGGHVHLHALHYGPWVSQRALAACARMMVDVRRAKGDAVREVVKYALKGPSPRGAWMGGESARVPHPRLAAAWVVATRGRRLVEPYGVMRDALHAVDACEPDEEPEPPRCASCGCADLTDPVRLHTADVARESREMEARDPRGRPRWTLRAEVDARGQLSTAAPVRLPARVRFV